MIKNDFKETLLTVELTKDLPTATGSQSKETDRHSSELAAKYEMDNIQEYLDIQESIDQGSDLAAHYETLETNKTSHGNAYEDLIQKQET
ncbi:hypothetical protein MAR_021938 [Mya arenaria]|uniref:Uncharacterized protein n=1 Tax=Mya arenaria TaxID=6604 RepID=A0ABY7EBL4_MYAAR|nr:hypothetical protein MAR_021938 [Mya arenaria]